jgi:hypothetical protein
VCVGFQSKNAEKVIADAPCWINHRRRLGVLAVLEEIPCVDSDDLDEERCRLHVAILERSKKVKLGVSRAL